MSSEQQERQAKRSQQVGRRRVHGSQFLWASARIRTKPTGSTHAERYRGPRHRNTLGTRALEATTSWTAEFSSKTAVEDAGTAPLEA